MAFVWSAPPGLTLNDPEYDFDSEGRLRHRTTGAAFKFVDQAHYDALGDHVLEYIQSALVLKYNFKKILLPLDGEDDEPRNNIYASNDFETNSNKLLIIQQGTGAVRAGQFARALCINDCLATGTIFRGPPRLARPRRRWGDGAAAAYVEEATRKGYAVLVTNPNLNKVGAASVAAEARKIRGSEKAEAHTLYVWDRVVPQSPARDVVLVAHSYGGVCLLHLLHQRSDQVKARVRAIALTDSVHVVMPSVDPAAKKLLEKLAVNWVASDKPLDAAVRAREGRSGCRCVSAGHEKHEHTSAACRTSVFRFFDEALRA